MLFRRVINFNVVCGLFLGFHTVDTHAQDFLGLQVCLNPNNYGLFDMQENRLMVFQFCIIQVIYIFFYLLR